MKASILIKTIQDIMKIENNDPDIVYSETIGEREFSINSIAFNSSQIVLSNEYELKD